MAFVDTPEFSIGSFPNVVDNIAGAIAYANIVLNAINDKVAFVFQAPKDGELELFEWRTTNVGNNPDNGMRVSFQTVDPATGFPDGTQDQFFDMTGTFTANTWQVPAGPLTDDGTGGGTKRTVSQGEWLACVIEFVTFVVSDSIQIATVDNAAAYIYDNLAYVANAETGVYTKDPTGPVFALKYSDGTYGQFGIFNVPFSAINTRTFATGSTPDERALRFRLPVAARFSGVAIKGDFDNACDIILYDNSDSVLASVSLDPDIRQNASPGSYHIKLDADVELAANTTYRLAVLPTTASNVVIYDFTLNSADHRQAWPGGVEFYGSSRTDAGAWTDSTTTVPLIALSFNGIDTSGGGGGTGGSFTFLG